MDQKTKTILLGAATLLILAAVSGTALFLGKSFSKKNSAVEGVSTTSLSKLPTAPKSGDKELPKTNNITASNSKTFQGDGFNLNFSKTWGLLTCNNSSNIELDPTSSTDVKGFACDIARKPITILVSSKLNCSGDTVKLGNVEAVKSKKVDGNDIDYRWCVSVGGKSLDITHRVSPSGSRATSKDDFSLSIEEMISNIQFPGSGGS